jgi:hypothetical protein
LHRDLPAFNIVAEYSSSYIAIGFQGCSQESKVLFPQNIIFKTARRLTLLLLEVVSKLTASKMPTRKPSTSEQAG